MQGLVSIIIPAFNAERHIHRSLDSCSCQSYGDYEIIVVDDGSSDNTYEVVNQYSKGNSRCRIIRIKHKNGSRARNVGLNAARGKYIQYLDSDDELLKDKILSQVNVLERKDVNHVVVCAYKERFAERKEETRGILENCSIKADFMKKYLTGAVGFPPACYLFNRKMLDMIGPWDESITYNDDTEYICRIMRVASGITCQEEPLVVYYRDRPDSVGSKRNKSSYESELLVLKSVRRLYRNEHITYEREVAIAVSQYIFRIYPRFRHLRCEASRLLGEIGQDVERNFYNNRKRKISWLIGWKSIRIIEHMINRTRKILR